MWRQPRPGTKARPINRQNGTGPARRIPSFSLLMAVWFPLKTVCLTSRSGRLSAFPHRIDQQSGEQQQTGVAVGFEDTQAQRGIADLNAPDLPGERQT